MTLSTDFILLVAGFLLSLFTFSIILGDNWLFRFSSAILSGALAGYLLLLLVEKVLLQRVLNPLMETTATFNEQLIGIAVILAAVLLVIKFYFRSATGGNLVLGILLCVAAAVTIYGIVNGSLINLYRGLLIRTLPASGQENSILRGFEIACILLGAITSLLYSRHYLIGRKRAAAETTGGKLLDWLSRLGEVFTGIAMGAIFAGCFISSAIILIEQVSVLMGSGQELLQWVK